MTAEVDWSQIEADFRQRGYLASSSHVFQTHFRQAMHGWFSLAERLNELGHRIYIPATRLLQGRQVRDPVALGLQMMPRCLSAFQGSILLAERGLGIESQSLVRTVFETAFWMGYVKADPANAVPQLEKETLRSEIGLFEAGFRHLRGLSAETRTQCELQVFEMRERCSTLPDPPRPEQLALKSGYGQSYYFYRDLSGAATHLSMKSIHNFLNHDEDGNVVGHQIGPDEDSVGKAVWLSCRGFVLALDALQAIIEDRSNEAALRVLNEELGELEPYMPSHQVDRTR